MTTLGQTHNATFIKKTSYFYMFSKLEARWRARRLRECIRAHGGYNPPTEGRCILMKYRTSVLSIAMASIMLVAMVAAAGLTAAATPTTVGGPISGAPSATYDGTNYWWAAQGASVPAGNIYYQENTAGWLGPVGTGTNPCIVWLGTGTGATANLDLFWVNSAGAIVGRTTTNGGATWSPISSSLLPTVSVAAGTGPEAVYNPVALQLDVFYVAAGTNNLMWVSIPASGNTVVQNLGGQVYSTPAAAEVTTSNTTVLVVQGSSNRIYEAMIAFGGFDGYSKLHDGLIGYGAKLYWNGTTGMYLFVAGTNSQLYMAASTNTGLTWETINAATGTGSHSSIWWTPLGGITHQAPSVPAGTGATTAEVFVAGSNGMAYINTVTVTPTPPVAYSWSAGLAGP